MDDTFVNLEKLFGIDFIQTELKASQTHWVRRHASKASTHGANGRYLKTSRKNRVDDLSRFSCGEQVQPLLNAMHTALLTFGHRVRFDDAARCVVVTRSVGTVLRAEEERNLSLSTRR